MKWQLLVLALAGALLGPAQAFAAGAPPALRVTIRDAADVPVAGAEVTVTDPQGPRIFARVTTGADGAAEIPSLPTGEVRVRVTGRLGNLALHQDGMDAQGILLVGQLPLVLALRVEPDGRVIPDPAMLALDPDGPLVVTPVAAAGSGTLASAQPIATATRLPIPTASPTPPAAEASPTAEAAPASSGLAPLQPGELAILGGLLATGLGLAALVLRWGRPV